MAERPLRVAVVAEEAAGVQLLHGLATLRPAPEVVAVLTGPAEDGGRRAVVREAAERLGLDVWPARAVRSAELALQLREAAVDLLLNVHSLHLIHPDVLAAPGIGSFNLHPGPLPEYAGLNVPSWAIYRGESSHAVTLHWMDEGIDTGAVVWQERFELGDDDTGLSVAGRCIRKGVPLLLRLARVAAEDPTRIPRTAQALARRRYYPAGPPAEGRIVWSEPAASIDRFVRAADYAPFVSPWGHPVAPLAGTTLGIAKASRTGLQASAPPGTIAEVGGSGALVAAADELILVERLWSDGRYLKPIELLAD